MKYLVRDFYLSNGTLSDIMIQRVNVLDQDGNEAKVVNEYDQVLIVNSNQIFDTEEAAFVGQMTLAKKFFMQAAAKSH